MEKIAKKREYRKNHIRHEKSALHHAERLSIPSVPESDCTGNLAGTEAPRANVDMARGTIDHCLYTADVRLPGTVGTSVGMGNLNTEGYALSANITLCHFPAPPYHQ